MRAEILSIGSELVSGQSLDTNSQWLSQKLASIGIPVHFHTTFGDDPADNLAAFQLAVGRSDLVLVTGGLGPTQDDLTREMLATIAHVPLVESAEMLSQIKAYFERRNREMKERNRVQALFPQGAIPLKNTKGTAPGIWMQVEKATVICLPGVPSEMTVMYENEVLPRLKSEGLANGVIFHKKINLFGKGESDIEAMAMDLTVRGRNPEVGITVHDALISFRIAQQAQTIEEAQRLIEPTRLLIHERFGDLVVGEDDVDVLKATAELLLTQKQTLATAESCTGGLVGRLLTSISGISKCYLGGFISYANQAKIDCLGVDPALIERCGAVSSEVAAAMARGAREKLKADIGVAITGIAGPGGGSVEKPVGLVYFGLATSDKVETKKILFGAEPGRAAVQSRSAQHALNLVRLWLLERSRKKI